MSASTQCPHSDVDFNIHHVGMADSNVAAVEIKAVCKICGKRMRLSRGLPMGACSRHPTQLPSDDNGPTCGITIPMIAEGEEPTKEWGFTITRTVLGEPG